MKKLTIILIVIAALLASASAYSKSPKITTRISKAQVQTWKCQDSLNEARYKRSHSPWSMPKSRAYRVWVLHLWNKRATSCGKRKQEIERQWDWQKWLPDNWQALGACETGYGKRPGNWFHENAVYVSAFGISRQEYDNDAAYMGVRGWYVEGKKPPTPWEQYQAALGHYKRFGDGWDCPGP